MPHHAQQDQLLQLPQQNQLPQQDQHRPSARQHRLDLGGPPAQVLPLHRYHLSSQLALLAQLVQRHRWLQPGPADQLAQPAQRHRLRQ